jgi:hypothetical protein
MGLPKMVDFVHPTAAARGGRGANLQKFFASFFQKRSASLCA